MTAWIGPFDEPGAYMLGGVGSWFAGVGVGCFAVSVLMAVVAKRTVSPAKRAEDAAYVAAREASIDAPISPSAAP